MKALHALICLLACCLLDGRPCHALNLSKSPAHYAAEMEYYYLKPRPEMLPSMLESFDRSGRLGDAEKRMFVASFLAVLARQGKAALRPLSVCRIGPHGRQTLAWAAYLGGDRTLAESLLAGSPDWAKAQMFKRPAQLENWDPAREKSILGMFWAAWFATGSNEWLDAIIEAAVKHAHNDKGGSRAAASLYDYAQGHEAIMRRLRRRLPEFRESEAQVLETILANGEGKRRPGS